MSAIYVMVKNKGICAFFSTDSDGISKQEENMTVLNRMSKSQFVHDVFVNPGP